MAVIKNPDPRNQPRPAKKTPAEMPTSAAGRTVSRRDDEPGSLSMTGIRSGVLNSIIVKVMLGLLILIFAVGFALSAIGPNADGSDPNAPKPLGGGPDPVARVGDQDIARPQFQNALARQIQMMSQFGQPTGPVEMLTMRQNVLDSLAGEAAQYIEAKKQGFDASEAEIDAKIDEFINDSLKPQGTQTEAAVRRSIEAEHGSIDNYKTTQRKNYVRELVARQIVNDKLEKKIKDDNKVSEADYKRSVTRLGLRQIKISPQPDAKAKDPKAALATAETNAKKEAETLAAKLKSGNVAAFVAAAKAQSDDLGTKSKGGDIGAKLPTELPFGPEIRDAIVGAKSNFVGPVQDPNLKDWFVFLITSRKEELPKDFAKTKVAALKTFEDQKDNEVWTKFQTDLKEKNKPEVFDPALVAYDVQNKQLYAAQGDAQKQLRSGAIEQYEDALQYASGTEAAAIRYQLARLYSEAGQRDKQLETLKAAVDGGGDVKQIRTDYARALIDAKNNPEALKQVQELSKEVDQSPSQPSMFGGGNPDDALRNQISSLYESLGKKDLAAKERAKIKPPAPMPGMGGPGGNSINLGSAGGANQTITIPSR